jgi:hypothetical protein
LEERREEEVKLTNKKGQGGIVGEWVSKRRVLSVLL